MKIVATVLLGPDAEKSVGEAIASVKSHVDAFLFIESGGGQAALLAACEAAGKVPRASTPYAWVGDYGAARQFALDLARKMDATHALTLDPDERIDLPADFRLVIEAHPEADVWILPDRDTGYFKERIIRTNAKAFWHGKVCEFLDGRDVAGARLPGHFWELPKDDAAERRRYERGITACTEMIEAGDDCYRWRRHRGSCFMGLGQQPEALADYRAALPMALNTHETAWMRYLICEQLVLTGQTGDARALAAVGLADHAGFVPEFGWILGYTDQDKNPQNASRWAQLVLATPPDRTRIGFRGQNCKRGARELLQSLHGAQPEEMTTPGGVSVRPLMTSAQAAQ